MIKFFNPHPKHLLVGDCLKRALCLLEDQEYNEVSKKLNNLKKENGCKKYNEDRNFKEYMKRTGWEYISFPAEKGKPRMNGEKFCDQFPKGKFLLNMSHHVTAVVDGVIYDTFDCSHKCVYCAWEVK